VITWANGKSARPQIAVGVLGDSLVSILFCLREINPQEILPQEDGGEQETLALAEQFRALVTREEEIKTRLRDQRFAGLDALVEVLADIAVRKKTLLQQLTDARQSAAAPLSEAWKECQSLASALDSAPDQEEARVRLRSALRRIVDSFWCLFCPRGSMRLAAVQVWFTGGAHRDYLILHQRARANVAASRPAQWCVRPLADVARSDNLDLRQREHGQRLLTILESLDVSRMVGR